MYYNMQYIKRIRTEHDLAETEEENEFPYQPELLEEPYQ
jgi:hypothetical protein